MAQPPHTPLPPAWADRLLRLVCPAELREELLGDLYEQFQEQVARLGEPTARRLYIWETIRFCRPYFIRRQFSRQTANSPIYDAPPLLNSSMLSNYLKIALRSFWQNKAVSFINILGLALGLTCGLFIFLWVQDERSVDRYHTNGPHLYQLMWRQLAEGKRMAMSATPAPMAQMLPIKFPEIVQATGYSDWHVSTTFRVGNKFAKQVGDWAGTDWFKMFSVPLVVGSAQTALKSPTNIVISRKLADMYFGSPQQAMGKPVQLDNKNVYQVTAVFENLPLNSSLQYDFLLNWDDYLARNAWAREWGNPSPRTYVQLRPDTDVALFEAKLKHVLRGFLGINAQNVNKFDVELFLQPFEEAYLYGQTENGEVSGGRIDYVRLLSMVAVFILLIACINFMNLSTARSATRAKEVGVRKVIGAERSRLIGQFLAETLLITTLAVVVALVGVELLLPSFNQLSGKHLALPVGKLDFWLALGCILLSTGLVAGCYPAFFLSSLQPIGVLKGTGFVLRGGSLRFRELLVVVQFVISLFLMIGTVVVYRQVQFIQTKNLGFDRENLIYVPLEGALVANYSLLKQELQPMPGIQGVARMDYYPSNIGSTTSSVDWPGKAANTTVKFAQASVGYDMDKVLKMKLVNGRFFSPSFSTDSASYVINRQAAQQIGYHDPIGKPLTFWGKPGKIIGVVENFHFQSLREPIRPIILWFGEQAPSGLLLVRTQRGQSRQALASLKTLCHQVAPDIPFSYSFADEAYQRLYQQEQLVGELINYSAVLSLFIACLGLFGLASLMAEQRRKELGIRKVIGASVVSLVGLLTRDMLKLVVIAIAITCPLAWYVMSQWLQGYTYKADLPWWVFAGSGVLALSLAFVTISYQSIKVALINPVKSL